MIYCIIGENGVCNNDFSSGCYKCCMAMCYDDSREVMGLQECVRQAMELISVLQKESVSPAVPGKLQQHQQCPGRFCRKRHPVYRYELSEQHSAGTAGTVAL